MALASTLLLLLAPILVRTPVGSGDWERLGDPVQRRLSSLMVGDAIVSGTTVVVPLYARVPSEAGHGRPAAVAWLGDAVTGRLLFEDGRYYLRVVNPTARSAFVAAGTVFRSGDLEVYVAHGAIVPAEFAALLPAPPSQPVQASAAARKFRRDSILPPAATGALLHEGVPFANVARSAWRMHGAETYARVLHSPRVRVKRDGLRSRTARLEDAMGGTAVGAVFLVGNRPVAVHFFLTHALFRAALPDLLYGLAVQAREEELRLGGNTLLVHQAQAGGARGRALGLLRNLLRLRGAWSESYGAGFEVTMRSEADRTVGQAIIDHAGTVVHASFFDLGRWWPGKAVAGGGVVRGPAGPAGRRPRPPPDTGKGETPPGVVDRKARPSLAEARQRARSSNPGPTPRGSSGGGAGGGGAGGGGAGGGRTGPR